MRRWSAELPTLLPQALAADPNFIRLDKGAYSLHCFHPEREQLVRVKKRKFEFGERRCCGRCGPCCQHWHQTTVRTCAPLCSWQ
jgi:hypothetical protein